MSTPPAPHPPQPSGSPAASAPRRTALPDARITPRFAGLTSFCRYPRLQDVAAPGLPVDWILYGVPFDTGVTFRPGARFGPRAIRDASQYVKPYHIEHDVDVAQLLSLADAGDAPVSPFDLKGTLDLVTEFATDLGEDDAAPAGASTPARLLAVGGDHSIAYANIRATFIRQGEPRGGLAVVHFDSHLDTVDAVWGEKWSHASPFRRAIEEGLIDPKRMISIGVKGPLNTAADLDYARTQGVTLLTREALRTGVATDRIRDYLARVGDAPTYLTFDIDVVDPAFAPGTGTPSVGGLSSIEALELLRRFKGMNIVGADVVEVLPDRDVAGITALLAAHILFEILALDAARRVARKP